MAVKKFVLSLIVPLFSLALLADPSCPVGLRDFLTNSMTKDQVSCSEYFLKQLRARDPNPTTAEFDLLPNRVGKDVVMGLLTLVKNRHGSDETLTAIKQKYAAELSKISKKTKKTSDIFVLSKFFQALDEADLDQTLGELAQAVEFRVPRQPVQRLEPEINFAQLKAAACMQTLTTTVMKILSNTAEGTECAKQMKKALNSPQKKNKIVKEYESFASKNAKREFWVDASLVPHKAGKSTDKGIKMSYKGVMQGVFNDVAKGKKLPNLRIARILAIQGIELEGGQQKSALLEGVKKADKSTLRPVMPLDLQKQIKEFDKGTLKPVHIVVTPNLLDDIRNFNQSKLKKAKPTKDEVAAVTTLLKAVTSDPNEAVDNSRALVPYVPKHDQVFVIDPHFLISQHQQTQGGQDPAQELAIVPYTGKTAEQATTIVLTPEMIKEMQYYLKMLEKKKMPKQATETRVLEILEEVAAAPALTRSITHKKPEDDWYNKPVEEQDPQVKKKRLVPFKNPTKRS